MDPTAPEKTFTIGLITGSQRTPRCGDQIATFVLTTLQSHLSQSPSPSLPNLTFLPIDIALLPLPLYNEPAVPSTIRNPQDYVHAHTRSWSATITSCNAFIFVTPQYNWGIPAGLKNAIDYLYHEWRGKPAMIVSYGGHGGDKAAAALKIVLGGGLGMRVVEESVCLAFPDRETLYRAAGGGDLGLVEGAMWEDKKGDVVRVWEEMVRLLET